MLLEDDVKNRRSINTKELLLIFISSRYLILSFAALGFLISMLIYSNTPVWWTSQTEISKPQYHSYSSFTQYANSLKMGDISNKELTKIIDPIENYSMFINQLSSYTNKKNYIENTLVFKNYLTVNKINDEPDIIKTLDNFTKKIIVKKTSLILNSDSYQLITLAMTPDESLSFLTGYIEYTRKNINTEVFKSLSHFRDNLMHDLTNQLSESEAYADLERQRHLIETEAAIKIANKSEIKKPLLNFHVEKKYLNITLGSEALTTERDLLKNSDISIVFNNKYTTLKNKLDAINSLTIPDVQNDAFFNFLEKPRKLLTPAGSNKNDIVLSITFIFILFGFFIALILAFFNISVHPFFIKKNLRK
ncbi:MULTISPECIES: hypothetical protein [unclassified Vibrio]|nr:hypothetical protein [Vibrio sp. 10N.261.52.E5]PMK81553.1 hypothetical protein BCT92_14890 [Vibrio sp. 10N.261.52.E5]